MYLGTHTHVLHTHIEGEEAMNLGDDGGSFKRGAGWKKGKKRNDKIPKMFNL